MAVAFTITIAVVLVIVTVLLANEAHREKDAEMAPAQSGTEFAKRVRSVRWRDYDTAYGNAIVVADQIVRLNSADLETAKNAANELWGGLCHQLAYVSSAALPAAPFFLEVLGSAKEDLVVEIMDIFLGFANCSHPRLSTAENEQWMAELRQLLIQELPRWQELKLHRNEEIRDVAGLVIESLSETAT